MKKLFALIVMAIFVFSIMPIAFAEDDGSIRIESKASSELDSDSTEVSIRQGIRAEVKDPTLMREMKETQRELTINGTRCMERCKQELRDGRIKSECEVKCKANEHFDTAIGDKVDFRERNRLRLQKIASLDARQIEKLSSLDVNAVEKISMLKKERLDRLSNLSAEKIERLAELDSEDLERITHLSTDEIRKLSAVSKHELKELVEKDPTRLKAELRSKVVLKIRDAEDLNRREISEQTRQQLKIKYDQANIRFNETKDGLKEIKQELREAKKDGDESAVLENAKQYLLKTADAMISHLEKLKAKIQESENIEASAEARIVANIDSQIADLNSIKDEINAASTKEQIKQASAKLRQKWNNLKHIASLHAERIVASRVEGIVNHGLVLEKRLEHILGEMRENNLSVDVSAEVDVFSGHMADAKESYVSAQAKLSEAMELDANSTSRMKELADEAKGLLKQSRDSVKAAHEVLKDIVKKIKEVEPEADLSQEIEVEVVSQVSSETAISTS